MSMLPQDPMILLSVVNTRLRDTCPTLEELCAQEGIAPEELTARLAGAGFHYDRARNQFV